MDQRLVYLAGGDEFSSATKAADRHVLAMFREPVVAIVPTAAVGQRPELAAGNGVRHFTELGARAEAAMILDDADAASTGLCSQLDRADVIYLTGGDPARVDDVLQESRASGALRRALERGAIVAGSSAGAMALGPVVVFPGRGVRDGLHMVDVVTVPHSESISDERLQELALTIGRDHGIVAIPSQSGCLITGERLESLGPDAASLFARGSWRPVEPGEATSLRL